MNDIGKPSEDREVIPLPLVIGVTGHDDLRDEDRQKLEAQVQGVFADLRRRYPSTPLVLLSPLAEGADRLVARIALEQGVRLIVPLPMSKALYEEDFQTQASREEFNKLLQQAEWWFELPLRQDTGGDEVEQQGPARDQQYAEVGAYISLHCQILIALWDGRYTHRLGGTSQIVEFQLHGVPRSYLPRHSPLDEPERGPVYHIVTPRVTNPDPVEQHFELRKLIPARSSQNRAFPDEDDEENQQNGQNSPTSRKQKKSADAAKQEFDLIFEHLDTFNRDILDIGAHLEKKQEQSKAYLLGNLDTTTLSPALNVTLERYADLYAVTDTLAMHFRNRTVNTLFFLFSLFFIAVLFFNLFSDLGGFLVAFLGNQWGAMLQFLLLALYLIFLFGAYFIWYNRTSRGHYMSKYLDYRALAEGLRVQFFWRLAGVKDSVATHYLRKQRSELDWIRNSIRVANLLCDESIEQNPPESLGDAVSNRYRLIVKQWVEDQASWFARATGRDQRKLEAHGQWVHRFFVAGMGLALLLFLLQFLQLLPQYSQWISSLPLINLLLVKIPLIELLIVLMTSVLALAALREGYTDKMAYTEEIKQYERMSHLFGLASRHLKEALEQHKPEEAERLIRELGEEALAENGDWVMLHRARPINVPIGG